MRPAPVGGAVNRPSPQTKSHSPEKFIAELLERLLELIHVLTPLFEMLLEANLQLVIHASLANVGSASPPRSGREHITQFTQREPTSPTVTASPRTTFPSVVCPAHATAH